MQPWIGRIAAAVFVAAGSMAHAAAPSEPGTISVEPTVVEEALEPSVPAFVEAVGRALGAHAYTVIDGVGHGRFVAELTLSREEVGTTTGKVAVSGPSAVAGGNPSRVGGGVSFSLPTSKTRTMALQQTRLELHIRKRGEQDDLWHATAMTVRASDVRNGTDSIVATDLAEAIFRTYPTQSDGVISVP